LPSSFLLGCFSVVPAKIFPLCIGSFLTAFAFRHAGVRWRVALGGGAVCHRISAQPMARHGPWPAARLPLLDVRPPPAMAGSSAASRGRAVRTGGWRRSCGRSAVERFSDRIVLENGNRRPRLLALRMLPWRSGPPAPWTQRSAYVALAERHEECRTASGTRRVS